MFARTPVQSRPWRLFAIITGAVAVPVLLKVGSPTESLRAILSGIALVGLVGYAFVFRIGPQLFWRVFSIVFVVGAMLRFGRFVAPSLHSLSATPPVDGHHPAIIALAFAMFAALSLALFRHAELVGGGHQSLPSSTPEPLFPSPAERMRRIQQSMAEARAEVERPMSTAMQREALSLGHRRQLSLLQYRRATSFMFFGSLAAQVGLGLLRGGNAAILVPAAALAVGCAAATYLSAELILKAQQRLAKSWKAGAILLAFAGGSFLFRDQLDVRPWLFKVIFSDAAAMMLGSLVVSTAYALVRRKW